MSCPRPRGLLLLALLALAVTVSLGCAGGADGRRTSSTLQVPGASGCATPRTPLALRGTPAADRGLLVGIHSGLRFFTGSGLCRVARATREVGAGAVREDFFWPAIERRRGQYDWRGTDRVALTAARWGFVLVPILGNGTPAWARGTRATAYARFVAAVVTRYAPGGTFWRAHPLEAAAAPVHFELWNEPYEPTNPQRLSVRAYANLVTRAIPAGRAASPTAKYLVAGDWTYRRPDGSRGTWIRELRALVPGLATLADAVTVHAYGERPEPFDPGYAEGQVGRVEAIRADLVAAGAARVPLWVTESGWSTCTSRRDCVSTATQARNLDRLFVYARTRWRGYVRALIIYQLQDRPNTPLADKESSFGLIRVSGRAKPARAVYLRRALPR